MLEAKIDKNDVTKVIRLGTRKSGVDRPMLVGLVDATKKGLIMSGLGNLRTAPEQYKNIGVSHDLAPDQQEAVKKVLKEARDKDGENKAKNWKYVVKGRTKTPTVVKMSRAN